MSLSSIQSSESSYWDQLFASLSSSAGTSAASKQTTSATSGSDIFASLASGSKQAEDPSSLGSNLFASLDTDGNDGLSLAESGLSQDTFNQLDSDGDGIISLAELENAIELQRAALPTMMMLEGELSPQEILASLFSSGEGSVTQAAAVQASGGSDQASALLEDEEEEDSEDSSTVYDPMDINQDGVVSDSERSIYMESQMGFGQQGDERPQGPPPEGFRAMQAMAFNAYQMQGQGYAQAAASDLLSMSA